MVGEELGTYEKNELIRELEEQMHQAARDLEFERAAELRDRIENLKHPTLEKPVAPRRARRSRRG